MFTFIKYRFIHAGTSSVDVTVANNATITVKCVSNGVRPPDWFVNGTVVVTDGDPRYRLRTSNGVDKTATLTINGIFRNTLNIYCDVYNMMERQFIPMHNTTLIFQG